ncbi:MAG: biotin synthase BioB [Omnitrophica WOR_2 bacterium GWF2_43_52]|nr:MAG: biotin synthase BioB [Omnitrophica WOR_2 bacterium GWA2_44_7]OGX14314.1 MAG: biotin synthase BioB [Omnitrophica WOR_2 bacterium GWC2_44_8]OGX21651.1 MAG: biotin synthase BioB [Omnitrophica WOR_2 bacterium GWF2_43_52]OGX53221.1 MAG: biotin synthase BioB [Omnitrophica WOR_2 bacterium RIFOXYC2_FULL_43_9]HAH20905.1 biotin synthase BioB [Candidatus Omnitrophota bacterium]
MKSVNLINKIRDKVIKCNDITWEQAHKLKEVKEDGLYSLFNAAYTIRKKFRGKKVELCAITNARSGACSENCAFCAQSSWNKTKVKVYPLLEEKEVLKKAAQAQGAGAGYFCIVTSGRRIQDKNDFLRICKTISKIRKKLKLNVDASLGELSFDEAKALKEAGLFRYNHNLETAQSLYPQVCTTHTYADRIKTIENVKKAGLELCCGGIFGMGESWSQRLELAFALKAFSPECIPVNFLNPVPGTRLGSQPPSSPLEFLKITALLRFIFPKQEIKVCGGREANLRSLQPFLFLAGADSIIIGDYLTTKGNPPPADLQMIQDLGLSTN